MTLKTFWIVCALSLYTAASTWAAGQTEKPPHLKNPVWVMVFWLHPLDNKDTAEIASIELGGEAVSPEICASLPMSDVLKPVEDAAQNIEAGLTPVVVCGIAAPTESKEKPHVRSEPGHPDQPQGPSGNILYLPHRALHEIDIQGHEIATPGNLCPGQYEERVPYTGQHLFCWGHKHD